MTSTFKALAGRSRGFVLLLLLLLSCLTFTAVAAKDDADSTPAPPPPPAEEAERISSLALCLVLLLLIFSFWTSYYLKVKRITAVHETIVGLFAGMLVGAALRIGPGEQVQKMLTFSNTIMLNVLLPPIILSSGYDLRQEAFFRNFGVILTFAFAGTFISAIIIGVITYIWSLLHLESLSLSLLECLIFGSTLSATDPVTILAIFNTYKVDPQLYSVIFGESILNDAVSIVMFDVLSTFRGKSISIASLFHGLGLFLFIFTFSMALGVAFGLGCSLMLKHSRLSAYPPLESCLVALLAYTSYFFSNGVGMGGIVSLLFCGITLKHYAYHNMSRRTQRATKYIFQTLANLSENFIFIYLGLSLFTQSELVYKPLFIMVTVIAVVASRYCAVFPIASLVNAVKRTRARRRARRAGLSGGLRATQNPSDEELPREYQMMLFWAGLRGAVGFALSAGIEGQNAAALQTTVLVAVVTTVVAFGGTTAQMLSILGIRTGVEDEEGDSDEEEALEDQLRLRTARRRRGMSGGAGGASRRTTKGRGSDSRPLFRNGVLDSAEGGDASDASDASDEILPPTTSAARLSDVLSSAQQHGATSSADGVEDQGVRAFLDRAGLIMRDGRWFSTLDQRYLTPLFTNSVASRKHEERKAARKADLAAAASDDATGFGGSSGSGGAGNMWTSAGGVNEADAWAAGTERDADVRDSSDEGDTEIRRLGTPSGALRRTPSRGASFDGSNTDSATGSARVSGAFTPTAGGRVGRNGLVDY